MRSTTARAGYAGDVMTWRGVKNRKTDRKISLDLPLKMNRKFQAIMSTLKNWLEDGKAARGASTAGAVDALKRADGPAIRSDRAPP